MVQSGRGIFGQMEEVLFGRPAAEAVAEEARRLDVDRPPHTPRHAVIEAAELARDVNADLIVTIGGGSVTDGAKAVQFCLANDIRTPEVLDDYRAIKGPDGTLGSPRCNPPSVRQITVHTSDE